MSRAYMKTFSALLFTFCLLPHIANSDTRELAKNLVEHKLAGIASNGLILDAIEVENAKQKTVEEINLVDKKWMDSPTVNEFMRSMMKSKCSQYLLLLMSDDPLFEEIFVTDNQGANVCMTSKTSDYWQGDESKFTEAFADGHGGLYLGDVEFDDSTQSYIIQVGLPVKSAGSAVGTVIFGINVEELE